MLSIIKELLLKIINDIDTGNSNLSAKECEEVIDYLSLRMKSLVNIKLVNI